MQTSEGARRAATVLVTVLLAACGEPAGTPGAATTASAPPATAAPADPQTARLYDQTCRACHTAPASGAPQSGDRKAWEARLAQGMPVLVEHTIRGFKGMPPLGTCMDCTPADFEKLIRYMAGEAPTGS